MVAVPPPPTAPCATQLHTSDAARAVTHPAIIPLPLNTPLNLTPVSNGIKAINAAVTPPGHPSLVCHGPYKRAMRPSALTAPPHCTLSHLP
jgi:hypothetical protein